MINVNSSNFQEEVINSEGIVLVDFFANWCGPCRILGKTLEENEEKLGVKIVKIDIEESSDIAGLHSIKSVPTLALYKDGVLVHTTTGNLPFEKLKSFVALAK